MTWPRTCPPSCAADALALFTRVPGAAPAKTRLAAALGESRATTLARAFLLDTLCRIHALDVAHSLWYTPPGALQPLRLLLTEADGGRWHLRVPEAASDGARRHARQVHDETWRRPSGRRLPGGSSAPHPEQSDPALSELSTGPVGGESWPMREGEAPAEPPPHPDPEQRLGRSLALPVRPSYPARALGPAPRPALEAARPLDLIPQTPGSLDQRLESALHSLLARGHARVCVIGSDSPTLPLPRITEAFEALRTADFALVPAHDGGFALLGARIAPPRLLVGIDWSTNRTFAQTCDRLARLGSVQVLDAWYDIDTEEDLRRLASDAELERCPATRAALQGLVKRLV